MSKPRGRQMRNLSIAGFVLCRATLLLAACSPQSSDIAAKADARTNWPNYGQNAKELHFSSLTQTSGDPVARLGLARSYDLSAGNPMSHPVAVDGVLYTSTGYSVVHAFDAVTGKVMWTFDPGVAEVSGRKPRQVWGSTPDLQASSVPLDANAFAAVVRGGALLSAGMPRYEELTDADLADLRPNIRSAAGA